MFKRLRAGFTEAREKVNRQQLVDDRKKRGASRGGKDAPREVAVWMNPPRRTRFPNRTTLAAVREPTNKHDRNAIALHYKDERVGYIGADEARELAPLMDSGARFSVTVTNLGELASDDLVGLDAPLKRLS